MVRKSAPTLLAMNDAARELGIATSTLRNHANSGRIPCIRLSNGDRAFEPSVIEHEVVRRVALEKVREA